MLHLTREGWVSASAALIDNMSGNTGLAHHLPVVLLLPSVLRSLEDF